MHDEIGDDAADDYTGRAHQHDQYALAHNTHDDGHIDLDEHQYDERGKQIRAETGIDRRLAWNQIDIVEDYGSRIYEQQWWHVLKQLGLRDLFEQEEECRDGA